MDWVVLTALKFLYQTQIQLAIWSSLLIFLHHLAGDYSLHFVAYDDLNSDGRLDEKGMIVLDAISGLNLSNVTGGVSNSVRLDVKVTGLLPL